MDQAIMLAEQQLEAAKELLADPAIATDGTALKQRMEDVETTQAEVDRLYARWAELEQILKP
jgi:ATP-binding cassette subfamily F protein uup